MSSKGRSDNGRQSTGRGGGDDASNGGDDGADPPASPLRSNSRDLSAEAAEAACRSYLATGNRSLDLSETSAAFLRRKSEESLNDAEMVRRYLQKEQTAAAAAAATAGPDEEDYFVGSPHNSFSAGEDSGEDDVVYKGDDDVEDSARRMMHTMSSGSSSEGIEEGGPSKKSVEKARERAKRILAGESSKAEYESFSIEEEATPPRSSSRVKKLLQMPMKLLSPARSTGTASTSPGSPASLSSVPSPPRRGSVGAEGYRQESQKNLAPKRRWSRDGMMWGDYTTAEGNDEVDVDDVTYDYAMTGLYPKKTLMEQLHGVGLSVAKGVGYCLGSVLRSLRLFYPCMCSLLLSTLVVAGYMAYREWRSTAGGVVHPHKGAYSNLSDEERYVIIRSKLIDEGISLHADLPESSDLKSAADEGESATPQYYSLLWISIYDTMRLDPDDPFLPQRYALAVLFCSTGRMGDPDTLFFAEDDFEAVLLTSKPGPDAPAEEGGQGKKLSTWIKDYNWMSGKDVCTWAGVDCHIHTKDHEGHKEEQEGDGWVRELNLPRNGLVGTIPRELVALSHLTILDLGDDDAILDLNGDDEDDRNDGHGGMEHYGGSIPETIWELKELVTVRLNGLWQTGTLPTSMGSSLPHLRELDLSNNHISGSIPPALGNATSLESLILDNNRLTGSIPESMGNLWHLVDLRLNNNRLNSTIPDDALGGLENLVHVEVGNNTLTGPVPSSVLSLQFLEVFEACRNELTGTLPAESFDAESDLRELILCDNRITGTIPPSLGLLSDLEILSLSSNHLKGHIPPQLGGLERLIEAEFQHNLLIGKVPDEMCAPEGEEQQLSIGADCLGRVCGKGDYSNPGVECCCCDVCTSWI